MRRIIYKIARVIAWTLLGVQVAVTGALVVGNLTGHQVMTITGGSMEPTYHLGASVLLDITPDEPAVGDVITFFSTNDVVTTHRVIAFHDVKGESFMQTQGDANPEPDHDLVSTGSVIGTPSDLSIPGVGYLITFMTSPVGRLLTFGPALAVIALREIRVLVKHFRSKSAGSPVAPEVEATA